MSRIAGRLRAAGMSEQGAASRALMFERVEAALQAEGAVVEHRYHVPGRIEVFGKHTDYAGGRSLLCAVEKGFAAVSARRRDSIVRVIDVGRGDESVLSFDPAFESTGLPHWSIYAAAVVKRLARDFDARLRGVDIALTSDLPPSSGLSSSSALLIAVYEGLRAANDLDAREDFRRALKMPFDAAAYLGSIESGRPFRGFEADAGVGIAGGNQDQTAILLSEPGRLLQVGYAPPRSEGAVDLPEDHIFVIAVSGVIAQKAGGAQASYNRAADHSKALLDVWNAETGRSDATPYEALVSSEDARERLDRALLVHATPFPAEDLRARLTQFHDETFDIIPNAFAALSEGDIARFGRLADRSQAGAERGLMNQVEETIALQRCARTLGAAAASAFGAGFGGSVWALVARERVDAFVEDWRREYARAFDHPQAAFFTAEAGPALTRLATPAS